MKDLLLAIDQGTSGCKLTIFDVNGIVVADTTKTYDTFYPEESWVEQDCEQWWKVIVEGIQEMLVTKKIDPKDIKGIGVDGISWASIPIDITGKVLMPTMIWLDRRAQKEAQWMKETVGEKALIELCGNPVDACYITPKMLWIKNNFPDIFAQTDKFLQSNGFIVYRLTGQLSQDYSQGYGFHFFDMKKGCLDEAMAIKLGLSTQLVAPFYQSHEIVGGITPEVAKLTGLCVGTPVVAGGLDAACCTLGAGVIHVGQTQEQGGQAGGMSIALDSPLIHEKLILGYHVVPNMWLLQGGTTGGGGTLNWFNKELGTYENTLAKERNMVVSKENSDNQIVKKMNAYDVFSEEAESISPGSDGLIFLPYMKGERSPLWNGNAKGVYYGLTYDKSRAHMVRSMMEGVAYSLKHNIDTAKEVNAQVNILSSVGGSSNSSVWTQMKSDMTGCIIEVPYSDYATTLGAAILAGVGVGLYQDFEEAVNKTVRIQRVHTPNPETKECYEKGYKTYLKLSNLLCEAMWT